MVKMLTVLVSTVSNSQLFLLKKNVSSFCKCKSYSHSFSKNVSVYAIYNDQSFNDMLSNDIVSFDKLGPGCQIMRLIKAFAVNLRNLLIQNIILTNTKKTESDSKDI